MRLPIALLAAVLAAPWLGAAPAGPPASGAYDDAMLLAYDPATHAVTGYFSMERGEAPSFACIFYLRGALDGPKAALKTWFPATPAAVIGGTLERSGPKTFEVTLNQEPGGCGMAGAFAANAAETFELSAAHPWTQVRVIRADKAHFWDNPTSPAPRKAYIVKGDGVGVRTVQGAWLLVDYVGGEKTVSGWIKASDVYP